MQKLVITFVLLIFGLPAFACRYAMMEQNGRYYIYQKLMGDLPSKSEEITSDLSRGIKDIEVAPKKKNDNDEKSEKPAEKIEDTKQDSAEPRKARIRVRFDTDNKEEAEKYLKIRCRE